MTVKVSSGGCEERERRESWMFIKVTKVVATVLVVVTRVVVMRPTERVLVLT